MATPIKMPQPGNTVEECILVAWKCARGDRVTAGQIIAEIETDKANFEVEAPVDGVLLETFARAGDLVPVLTNIAVIGDPGEDVESLRPKQEAGGTKAGAPAGPEIPASAAQAAGAPAPPRPDAVAAAPVREAPAAAPSRAALSPRAKRFAEEQDFFPANVAGSGPGGRVLEQDLRDLFFRTPRASPLARAMMADGFTARAEGTGVAWMVRSPDLTRPPEKRSRLRETVARRMRESLATTAQYTMHTSADAAGLLALRAKIKAQAGQGRLFDININDLVMFCAARTLAEFPELNAEYIDGAVYLHSSIHLGFACDTPRGLVVPVVRDCQSKPLDDMAKAIHALAEAALSGTISPDDLTGGTFTVSNLGNLGIEAFTPIVNPPQVAILGVDAIQLKPVRRNGAVEFADRLGLSLTCDHQVVDGAPGARFLKRLREIIEDVEAVSGLRL